MFALFRIYCLPLPDDAGPPQAVMLNLHPFILWVHHPLLALPSSVLWALANEQIFDINYKSLQWRMKAVTSH